MKYIYFIMIFITVLQPIPAPAELPDGVSNPAFQDAIEVWLSDDDATSLPALSRLAHGGNRAAQILLGQIELHEASPSRWVAALSRDERRVVFRAPGGKFGKSWLAIAAEHEPLARALYSARDPEQMEDVIASLYAFGELRAMVPTVFRLLNHGKWEELVALESQGVLPPELRYIVWYAALFAPDAEAASLRRDGEDALRRLDDEQGLMFLALSRDLLTSSKSEAFKSMIPIVRWFAYGQHGESVPEFAENFSDAILESDETKQIAMACQALCPTQLRSCAATAWSVLGGYQTNLELGSPVATLIPTARYVQSERARGELLRRIVLSSNIYVSPGAFIRNVADSSRCLADQLKTVISR